MCIKCEKLREHKKELDNCKLLLRSLIDIIDDIEDSICDNVRIEDKDYTYIFPIEDVDNPDIETDEELPELEDD